MLGIFGFGGSEDQNKEPEPDARAGDQTEKPLGEIMKEFGSTSDQSKEPDEFHDASDERLTDTQRHDSRDRRVGDPKHDELEAEVAVLSPHKAITPREDLAIELNPEDDDDDDHGGYFNDEDPGRSTLRLSGLIPRNEAQRTSESERESAASDHERYEERREARPRKAKLKRVTEPRDDEARSLLRRREFDNEDEHPETRPLMRDEFGDGFSRAGRKSKTAVDKLQAWMGDADPQILYVRGQARSVLWAVVALCGFYMLYLQIEVVQMFGQISELHSQIYELQEVGWVPGGRWHGISS